MADTRPPCEGSVRSSREGLVSHRLREASVCWAHSQRAKIKVRTYNGIRINYYLPHRSFHQRREGSHGVRESVAFKGIAGERYSTQSEATSKSDERRWTSSIQREHQVAILCYRDEGSSLLRLMLGFRRSRYAWAQILCEDRNSSTSVPLGLSVMRFLQPWLQWWLFELNCGFPSIKGICFISMQVVRVRKWLRYSLQVLMRRLKRRI